MSHHGHPFFMLISVTGVDKTVIHILGNYFN